MKDEWKKAADDAMDSLNIIYTWELVNKPNSQTLIGCKWIYKRKQGIQGFEQARLVAKGFIQREGIDYNEVFSVVVKHTSIRLMLVMVAYMNMELE